MTSSPYGLYAQGYTRATMAGTESRVTAMSLSPYKPGLSPDCSLHLVSMKFESLVVPYQHAAVNTFPGLVHTARHTTKAGCSLSS